MKFNKYLLLLAFFAGNWQVSPAKKAAPSDSVTLSYFKKNIEQYEKSVMGYPGQGTPLKISQLDQSAKRIWALWKKANTDLSELPEPIMAKPELKAYPVHQWQMKAEDPMPFYYFSKEDQPSTGYPLFLNLHGSGPKIAEFNATIGWSLRYKDAPAIYFIPQIPNERRYRWWFKPEQYAWEKLFRLAMISGKVDANKIYVMGISEGGYGSQRLGAFYADYLAGAGPMAGGEPLRNAPVLNYRNIAFSFQTGENDNGFGRNKLTNRAKVVFDSLQRVYKTGFTHKIELQAGKGHGIDYTKTTPYLIQHVRNPQPAALSWVLFPMDGRYRNGFYNISIDKALGLKEGEELDRAVFDIQMDKSNNTINLEVKLQDGEGLKSAAVKQGEISIFLSPKLMDLSKKVKLMYKGKVVFNAKVKLSDAVLAESCALFGDPERLFPAKIKLIL
ncbi:hypothetical protein [Pedobacter gandavensis]|uniref:hypothetical protein n=1 Tax=Pedobacter gandavensis TaxID=2679963 RepID=UPI00292FFEBD|nr:hypothetical protein [Pedobacter gandavensis]